MTMPKEILFDISGISEEGLMRINKNYAGLNKASYYNISPRIVKAGKKSTITIASKSETIQLVGTYSVIIFPYYEYEYVPCAVYHEQIMEIAAQNGMIEIEYTFSSEQMYCIIVGKKLDSGLGIILRTAVYALEDDLYDLKPLIGDFHSHTIYSDGLETPEGLLDSAISHGFNFIAVTDHNNYEGSAVTAEIAARKSLPITVINGVEYSSNFTNMHIIALGNDAKLPGWCYWVLDEDVKNGVSEISCIHRLCEQIRQNGGVAVMCHPLWKPLRADMKRLDVSHSLVKELMQANVFDAIEIVSGSPLEDSMTSQMHYIWANSYGATCDKVAYLGSTDAHFYTIDPICGKHFTLVLATENSQTAIINAIRNKLTVAVQLIDEKNALLYGSPRLCMFAQFYLREILKKITN